MSEEQLIPTPSVFGENGNLIIERELGCGGMGGVYLGRDKMLDRPIAVKAMLREYGNDPEFIEKFKKEAQAAARLIHPNIAQIYSYGIFDGIPYIVMELVAGGSLFQIMKNAGKNTDVPRVMKICEQVAQALRCASDNGFVHGDVKPENILLDANGNAKLVDFGLAAMQKDTDEIWGTPYYIAPEKIKKESIDYRADMFSLGATLYHALCGVAPFEGEDATAVVKKRFEGAPKKPSELREGISQQVDFLVMKMLAVDPADRYPTFEALLEDFKKVLTIGLSTTSSLASASDAVASAPKSPTSSGGKRIMLKPKKKLSLKTASSSVASEDESDAENDDVANEEEETNSSKKKSFKKSKFKPKLTNGSDDDGSDDDEEGGMGAKVLLVIGAVIATVALVAGGLIWYQVSDKKAREEEIRAAIASGVSSARDALAKTKAAAIKFADEFDAYAMEAVKDCQKPSDKLAQILGEVYADNVIAMLKPPPTKELLDAIASTNIVVATPEVATTNATDAAVATTNAAPVATAPAVATQQKPVERFRAPIDDEADPNSPEGEKYLAEKKKWEEEQKAKIAKAAEKEATPEVAKEEEKAPTEDANGKKTEAPAVVRDVNELWTKAYSCHAAAIRIRKAVNTLIADIEAAEQMPADDEDTMRKLVDKSNDLKARYDEIKNSSDVTLVQKAKGFIASRSKKAIEETVRKLREEAAQKARELAKKERLAAEEKRKQDLADARAKKVEEEIASAKACYEKVVAGGKIRQLDWKGAYRILDTLELETAEGQLELKTQKSKVESMEAMQNILIKGLREYTFTRPSKERKLNLRGAIVKKADSAKITVLRKGSNRNEEIPWQTFYAKYHNNLDEIISRFIVKSGAEGSTRLTKAQKFDAMVGVTFIMNIVCAENPTAISYGEKIAKEAAKVLPVKLKVLKEFFPNIDFSEVEKEVEAENL